MKHFTGRLNFFKCTTTGGLTVLIENELLSRDYSPPGYVKVGTTDVISVNFGDSREAEIEAIEAEMKQKSGELQHWHDLMAGKVKSLKAIEHSEVV